MKKILFSLVALVASMSMNAQVMKVMKDGIEVAKYDGAEYSVVFEEEPAVVNVTAITLNKATAELTLGGEAAQATTTLTATVAPENATDKTVTWSSDNVEVATVSAEGVVTAVKAGTATIKATANDGSGVVGSCTVTVKQTDPNILTFIAKQNNSTIKIDIDGTLYKTSTQDWTDYPQNQEITLSAGQFVQFKAASGSTRNVIYKKFVMTGSFAASGSVMSLLGEGQNMGENAFRDLFNGCSSLTAAPALPATTLADYCYYNMFYDCSSLTAAPALPATTLAVRCYQNMFDGCSSLTAAPALPATTLANYCYAYMFYGCSSLTAAPALPASTLPQGCYRNMFSKCSNLKSINVNFSTWPTNLALAAWVQGVSAEGTFTCPAGLQEEHADNRIPTGWTVVNP